MPDVDKIILSSNAALEGKYGAAGLSSIQTAIASLISADAARGIVTQYLAVDDAAAMTALEVSAVAPGSTDKALKSAVDGVFNAFAPDYLVLLGASDVIPHQRLTNPLFDPTDPRGDPDGDIPSDLPYACDAVYSTDPVDFIGPTRVVGRIPDLERANDPAYLIDLINVAAGAQPVPATVYRNVFGVSADIWTASTQASIAAAFGSGNGLQNSPMAGPHWTPAELGNLAHFINCHGAPADAHFYGEGTNGVQPIAHDAAHLAANAHPGTVVAAECCYGAELYDPATNAGQMGIANTYLGRGGYGFFGSTNTSYGPKSGNAHADLICRYFFQHLLAGSSIGLATLQARQDYVANNSPLDTFSLKTLAQFLLLGDPSIHPVEGADADSPMPHAARAAGAPSLTDRAQRRRRAMTRGLELARTTSVSASKSDGYATPDIQAALDQIAASERISVKAARRFSVRPPADPQVETALPASMKRRVPIPSAFHVLISRLSDSGPAVRSVALIAQEVEGRIGTVRTVYAKTATGHTLTDTPIAIRRG